MNHSKRITKPAIKMITCFWTLLIYIIVIFGLIDKIYQDSITEKKEEIEDNDFIIDWININTV